MKLIQHTCSGHNIYVLPGDLNSQLFVHFRKSFPLEWHLNTGCGRPLLSLPYDKNHHHQAVPIRWPSSRLLTDTEANQNLQTMWSHQPFSSLFVLSRREPVLHFSGTECSFSAPRPRHPLTPARPLTSAMEWWELRRKGAILQCDSVLLRAWRERKEIICAWSLAQAEAVSLRPHKHNSLTDQCGLYSGGGVDECIQCTSAFHWTSAT